MFQLRNKFRLGFQNLIVISAVTLMLPCVVAAQKENHMAVYFIVSYDIDDAEGYGGYVAAVMPLLQKHGGEGVVADAEAKSVEGAARMSNVVLRFESEEKAMAWYDDPDYEPLRQIRLDATSNGMMVLAKEFVPPS